MARTTIAAQAPTADGIAPAYAAAVAGDGMQYVNSGSTIVHVKNGSGGSITVTVATPGSVDGLALPDKVITVPIGDRMFSLRNERVYRQVDGYTYLDFSAVASVTVGVFEGGAA